jgi:hypothetical protein
MLPLENQPPLLKTILLSDNQPCEARVLGLFELADNAPELLGGYTYTILTITGEMLTVEYDLRNPELKLNPPRIPDNTNPEPNTSDWHELKRWHIHQAALLHEKARLESYERHLAFIATYIVNHCLRGDDRQRIVTPDDYDELCRAVLVPQLTEEVLSRELDGFFQSILQWPAGAGGLVFGEPQISGQVEGGGDAVMGD